MSEAQAQAQEQILYVDPETITSNRKERQRRSIDVETGGLLESIRQNGVISPILVRLDPSGPTTILVAGERRLECCRKLKIAVPIRYWSSTVDNDIIEIEENIKRADLPWIDFTLAIEKIHQRHKALDPLWTQQKTAAKLSISNGDVVKCLRVAQALRTGKPTSVENAGSLDGAYSILLRLSERRAAQIVQDMIDQADAEEQSEAGSETEAKTEAKTKPLTHIENSDEILEISDPAPGLKLKLEPKIKIDPILVADFRKWAPDYSGPKFSAIHCDFPYGVVITTERKQGLTEVYENTPQIYWQLTESFVKNIDRFASYSCHLIFWISMNHYVETIKALSEVGFTVNKHPLIWYKSDGASTMGGPGVPRHAYEAALFCVRGARPPIVLQTNCYASPVVTKAIQPTQKPEPMLKHFLKMIVDSTTDFLDPTAGSGSSIRVAEDLGAHSVLGLEINPEYAAAANAITQRARDLRLLNARNGDNEASQ